MRRIVEDMRNLWREMEECRSAGDVLLPEDHPRLQAWPSERASGLVVRTSGTTGSPKHVLISWEAMEARLQAAIRTIGLTSADVVCCDMPPASMPETYPVGGGALRLGGGHYDRGDLLPGETFTQMCERVGCTIVGATPSVGPAPFWLDAPTTAPVRVVLFYGAEVVDYVVSSAARWAQAARIAAYYAAREVGPIAITWDGVRDQRVGLPWDGVEVEVEAGEVWVRTPGAAAEYSDGSPVCDADGWFRTRDGGELRGGVLHLRGRLMRGVRDQRGVRPGRRFET